MGFIFRDSETPADSKTARIYSILFSIAVAVLAGIGILAIVLFIHDEVGSGFRMRRQMAMGLLSAAIVSGGLIALLFGIRGKKDAMKRALEKDEDDGKPWLQRPDWASGRIASSSGKAALLLWILVIFWCGVSAVISLGVILSQQNRQLREILMAVIFVIGATVISFAIRTTGAWRRYGRSIFEMPSVPAPAGGKLSGQVKVRGKLKPEHGWHIALSCVRRTTAGPSNNLRTTEKTLWRDEKWLRSDLPQGAAPFTCIPVFFQLPADKPESTPKIGDGDHWRLDVWGKLAGPDFSATFEVPVFNTDAGREVSEDPTAPYQVSLDEIRQQIRSKIQIISSPERREYLFPAGRNPGFATGAMIMCFIWTAIIVMLIVKHVPPLLPLVFGAMDVLMLYFVADLWLRRNHIIISRETIRIETGWLAFKKQAAVKISDAASFSAESGAIVGHSAYYDLKLRTRDGKEWLLAKNLGHKPEAEWLAAQMTMAAKIYSNQ